MKSQTPPSIDRLMQLLADQATQGITPTESLELATLLEKYPHIAAEELELAAAALDEAIQPAVSELPELLRFKLERTAERTLTLPRERSIARRPSKWWMFAACTGWIATAASILILLQIRNQPTTDQPKPGLSLVESREVLRSLPGTIEYQGSLGGRSGKVTWNHQTQSGFLEVNGLKPNDPTKSQYQLWIVDASRPDSPPIDGGVFDLSDSSQIVSIQAKLTVFDAKLFAVTEENPGGVVVSKNDKLLVLAK